MNINLEKKIMIVLIFLIPDSSGSGPAPPRPPPPAAQGQIHYGNATMSYPETTDDESEDLFQHAPTPSQGPIMVRTHIF